MRSGILAGVFWALETIALGMALSAAPFISSAQALFLSPFISTFLHDLFSAAWVGGFNTVRGDLPNVFRALRTKGGRFAALAAVIGGPVGMTGYVLAVRCMGASIGAVASAAFPAVGAVLAHIFLKEKMRWYRWIFLLLTLFGVYGLSFSPEVEIRDFRLGIVGVLMCAFGWGFEAVILARCLRDGDVEKRYALQIRQTTSALVYGAVLLPVLKGWPMTVSLFTQRMVKPLLYIAFAALFAALSYLCYYRAIHSIGAARAMALDVTYAAWALVFTAVIYRSADVLNVRTVLCTAVVLVCGILAAADFKELRKRKMD